ncbi:hypothetical protein VTK73DRAFT_6456 [Phialemonium thermophilum]|uniref:Carrier domain-containing protein n=1 Tax=Phialemonium thermophilum TaxID=223376 RepID=A0ABR3V0L5_9PEZI
MPSTRTSGGVRLDVVEAELLATGLVSAVAALKLQPPGSHTSLLVACVVYKTTTATTTSPMRPRKNDEELLARARARLPAYMVPRLVAWEALPVNRNGKIDRSRVLAEVEERFRHRQEELDAADVAVPSDGAVMTPTERKLKDLWCRVLVGIPPAHVGPEADFFAWGASSLDTASLIAGIRDRFDVQMPLRTVYEHPRLAAMAACIDQEQPQTFAEHAEAIKAVLRHDSTTLVKEVATSF